MDGPIWQIDYLIVRVDPPLGIMASFLDGSQVITELLSCALLSPIGRLKPFADYHC